MFSRYRPSTTFVVGLILGLVVGGFFRGPVSGVLFALFAALVLYLMFVYSSEKRALRFNQRLERWRNR